jgi:hypothetical protein
MHRSVAVSILVSILCFCWIADLSAEDFESSPRIWDFDSIAPDSTSLNVNSSAREVYLVMVRMIEQWNRHDLDAYLENYEKSPRLTIVVDSETIVGWEVLRDRYRHGYSDVEQMGQSSLSRVKVQMITPDLAFALSYWTVTFPRSKSVVVGINTDFLRRFSGEWKLIISHTSTAEM